MSMVDWPRVVKAITDAGWTQARIARELGWSDSKVSRIADGTVQRVRFRSGRDLVRLHEHVTGSRSCNYIDPKVYGALDFADTYMRA